MKGSEAEGTGFVRELLWCSRLGTVTARMGVSADSGDTAAGGLELDLKGSWEVEGSGRGD